MTPIIKELSRLSRRLVTVKLRLAKTRQELTALEHQIRRQAACLTSPASPEDDPAVRIEVVPRAHEGVCVCGKLVQDHFDRNNRRVGCAEALPQPGE